MLTDTFLGPKEDLIVGRSVDTVTLVPVRTCSVYRTGHSLPRKSSFPSPKYRVVAYTGCAPTPEGGNQDMSPYGGRVPDTQDTDTVSRLRRGKGPCHSYLLVKFENRVN